MRSLDALARLRPLEALRWNPLAFFLVLAAFAQPLFARDSRIASGFSSRNGARVLAGLVFVNWVYLCFALAR